MLDGWGLIQISGTLPSTHLRVSWSLIIDSTFTLLWQDEQSGLEFGDRATGEFMPAIAKNGVVYMNIGDMGQRISNGKLRKSFASPLQVY